MRSKEDLETIRVQKRSIGMWYVDQCVNSIEPSPFRFVNACLTGDTRQEYWCGDLTSHNLSGVCYFYYHCIGTKYNLQVLGCIYNTQALIDETAPFESPIEAASVKLLDLPKIVHDLLVCTEQVFHVCADERKGHFHGNFPLSA